jgi:hypothetical protein
METWQTILLAFGGNAALIAVLVLLSKSLLEKLIVRDTKVFEADLKRMADAEIERLKSEMSRNLESYKIQLKKSEVFFLRELEAASAFYSLFHSILPSYNNPSMDWYEACDAIAQDFGKIEMRLDDFMANYGAMLNDEERAILVSASSDAGYGKFEVVDGEVDTETNKKANDMYDSLKDLEAKLIKRVREQAAL